MKRSIRTLSLLAPLLLASTASGADRPFYDAYAAAKARIAPSVRDAGPAAFVSSRDEQRGVPTFLWAARKASPLPQQQLAGLGAEGAARLHLAQHAGLYGLSAAALSTAEVKEIHDTGRGGILVVLHQRVGGIELFHNAARVLMNRDLSLVAIGGNLHASAVPKLKKAAFTVGPAQAIANAFNDLYSIPITAKNLVDTKEIKADYRYYNLSPTPAVTAQKLHFTTPARAKKVYFPLPDRLVPAYYLELDAGKTTETTSDVYGYVIAADDGRVLYRTNLKHYDNFNYRVWADATGDKRPADGPLQDFTPHPTGIPDNSYPAYATPVLISIDGFNKNPNGVGDPWLAKGAIETNGNNVNAYTDDDAPDGFSPGDIRASITAAGTFDRLYNLDLGPQADDNQRQAAVTQIFYDTNWLHDWWYDSGFNEAAGNGQQDNYGRGGIAGDPLDAEGQDGAPTARNNANMDAKADGASPRMQMYVWDGKSSRSLNALGQSLATEIADFSPTSFMVSGDVVLVDDGTGTVTDACEPIVNDLTGKIALLDRGTCTFKQKAVYAQDAGAIGVILANNKPNQPPPQMSDSAMPAGPVTIPIMSITMEDGAAMKTALMTPPVTAQMTSQGSPDRDGTIDNSVVAHEWGHYLHLRLVDCGSPMCAGQSEGWADFNALMMVVRQGDNLDGTYALTQYATVSFLDPGYFGIRRYPYSTDLTKEPLTFKHIMDSEMLPAGIPLSDTGVPNSEAHNTGEVWAAMLFDAYVALLKQTELPSPPYTFAEARRRMSDYVVAGMKLAPADPTITEQRDGVLAAAFAADMNDFQLLAGGFAKRGAGSCAVSPPRQSKDFAGVVESFKLAPNVSILSVALDDSVMSCDSDGHLDAGETGQVTVKVLNDGTGNLTNTTATVVSTTPGISFPNGPKVTFGTVAPYTTATATIDLKLDGTVSKVENLDLQLVVESPDACTAMAKVAQDPLINFDDAKASSATDAVESETIVWALDGDAAKSVWGREEDTAPNHAWHGVDFASNSDTALESPDLDVSMTDDFVLTFDHRHQFETSMGTFWDGAVIEVTTDGKTWEDISKYGDPGYGGQIGDPQAHNPLLGQQGYVDHNPSWPSNDTVTISLGKALAGKKVKVRFRIGSDDAQDDIGWYIDNIAFKGITNTPFPAIVNNAKPCFAAPIADAGKDQTVNSGDMVVLDASGSKDPGGATLTFAWKETVGEAVPLADTMSTTLKFTAPAVSQDTTLTFQVTASDGKGSGSDSVNVLVKPKTSMGAGGAGGGGTGGGSTSGGDGLTPGGGCGCETAGNGGSAAPLGAFLGLALLGMRRRRRG